MIIASSKILQNPSQIWKCFLFFASWWFLKWQKPSRFYLTTEPLEQQSTFYYIVKIWLLGSFFSLSICHNKGNLMFLVLYPQVDVWALGVSAIEMAEVDIALYFFFVHFFFCDFLIFLYFFCISYFRACHQGPLCIQWEYVQCFSMPVSICG